MLNSNFFFDLPLSLVTNNKAKSWKLKLLTSTSLSSVLH